MKNTRAIRTAANTARFSMLTSLVASSGAAPSRPEERGATAPAATRGAPGRAPVRARPEPGVRTPSTWARTDTRRGAGETPGAGRRPPRRPRAGPAPSRESRAGNRAERLAHLPEQRPERRAQGGGSANDNERRARGRRVTRGAIRLTQSPAGAVAVHGESQLAAHRQADARGFGRFPPEHNERTAIHPAAPPGERLEFSAGGPSPAPGEASAQPAAPLRQ